MSVRDEWVIWVCAECGVQGDGRNSYGCSGHHRERADGQRRSSEMVPIVVERKAGTEQRADICEMVGDVRKARASEYPPSEYDGRYPSDDIDMRHGPDLYYGPRLIPLSLGEDGKVVEGEPIYP